MTLSFCAFASGDTAIMKHFNIENGLPSNNVYAVTQDNLGYIWFNTDNGIVKYNGYTFKLFTISDGLPSNDVWKLFPDKRGRLWVGTHSNKIGYIKDDKYKVVISSPDKAIHPSYINCDNNNVYFFYGVGYKKLVTVDSNDKVTISTIDGMGNQIVLSSISSNNILLLAKKDSIVYIRNLSKDTVTTKSRKMNFSMRQFTAYGGNMEYYNGKLLNICPILDYILVVDSNATKYRRVYFDEFGGGENEKVYTFYTKDDSLVIHTNKAIYLFGPSMKLWRRISIASVLPKAMQIAYYTTDDYRNEWFSSTNEGVWCKFYAKSIFRIDNGLSKLFNTKRIGAIESGNTYWVNRKLNIVYELTPTNHIRAFVPPKGSLPMHVEYRNDSEFYLSTSDGIYIYNSKGTFKSIASYFSLDTVKKYNLKPEPSVTVDSIWLKKTFRTVAWMHQVKQNKILLYILKPSLRLLEINNNVAKLSGLDSEHYNKIWYDKADNVCFLTTLNKIEVYNLANDKLTVFDAGFLSAFNINSVLDITSDAFSNIYILDNDKIVVINMRTHKVRYLKCNFYLANAFISTYKNTLIVAGKFGLAFAPIRGMLSIGKFQVAINRGNYSRIYDFVVNTTGAIYLSTDKGFINADLNELLATQQLVDPTSQNFFKLIISSPQQKKITSADTISISQTSAKINLNAINLLGNGNIQYAYIIEGYNADWQQTTTGEIFTGALKPDHYYRVQCITHDNSWVSSRFIFYIYKSPYWWQTSRWIITYWILGGLLFIGFAITTILLTRYVVARSNEKKRVLTELELKAVYAQINPHFIFNTLSAALYFINRKKFDDAYVHVNKFSRLIRGYLKSSQDRFISLNDEIEMLKNYIELQKTRFEEKFEYQIDIDNKLPVRNIMIPSLLLQPLVENAINHGLFHKKDGGKLMITFRQGAHIDEVICTIDDNGVGRAKAKEINKKSAVNRESYGTKLTQQLIAIFKQFENIEITLEYIDKEFPETGTIVKLVIKNIKYVA